MKTEVLDDHYIIKGKKYVRVTRLLDAVGLSDFSKIPAKDREFYMSRGTANHRLWQDVELGRDKDFTYDERVEAYREGHSRFLRETGFKAIKGGIEMRVWSDEHRLAGTMDRFGMIQGCLVLIDYKTSSVPPSTNIQTALYLLMLPYPFHSVKRYGVAFRNDGTYRMSKEYSPTDQREALFYIDKYWRENPDGHSH